MKKVSCLALALTICLAMASPVFADTFVPSIGYKDGPDTIDVALEFIEDDVVVEREEVGDCLIITSIIQAEEKTTDIYQEDRDLLLECYDKLSDGTMKLPLEDGYVIRELLDVNFKTTSCVESDHTHEEDLKNENSTVTAVFDLGVSKRAKVVVLSYHNGEWEPIKSVTNNGDGTVTCVFEHFCPVAFCVEENAAEDAVQTGDTAGADVLVWVTLMTVSAAAAAVLLVKGRKQEN